MQTLIRWSILVLIMFAFAPVPGPAQASFGDCASADYRRHFDERLAEVEYDCVERLRVPVNTPSGQRHIRIVHDRGADWIATAGDIAQFDRAVEASARAIAQLGGVELEDVTVLLADDFTPRTPDGREFDNIAAQANFGIDNDGDFSDEECHVVVYLIGPAREAEHAALSLAHEIFHCVHAANLRPEQIATTAAGTGSGGDWWIEGSADWFAALALPDAGTLRDRVVGFDAASPTTPLNRMAYDALPFFLWLGQELSPPGVMSFLRRMADERSESAQRAAMMSALPQDRWLDFAQAYLDGDIRHPHGTDLGFAPQQGDTWSWSATRTQTVTLEPFVLVRGVAAFECGRWRASVRPDGVSSARPEDGGDWGRLPPEIDTTADGGRSYRLAAINASPSRVTLNIQGTMEAGCGACLDIVETDACLFGTWQLTGGGAAEWVSRHGLPGRYSTANETMTFRRNGGFITGVVQATADTRIGDSGGHGEAVAQSGGRWSARDGRLNICSDMQMLSGQTVITTPEGRRVVIPVPEAPPSSSSISYACSETTLRTEVPIPGSPPIVSEYTRTSAPASE